MALNTNGSGGSERLWEGWLWAPIGGGGSEHLWKLWLWTLMQVMAHNAYARVALNAYANGGFEHLCKWWL